MTRSTSRAVLGAAIVAAAAFGATAARGQAAGGTPSGAVTDVPTWAFAVDPPAGSSSGATAPVDAAPRHVPGSVASFTPAQLHDLYAVPDWHPGSHPPMPEVVAHGRKPGIYACGYCHLPNGQGRPENSSLAGLSAGYITRQVEDFRAGLRKGSEPRHLPTTLMRGESAVTPEDLEAAARYFAALTPRPWIRVVETDVVPRTRVAGWMLVPSGEAGTEPIGERIVETPVDLERTELRDDTSGFTAYVPVGSLRKGESLVTTGDSGKTVPCASCHGPGLKGLGDAPRLAGRSPSYLVRQLFDIQRGARHGAGAVLMQEPVARLTLPDLVAIAAYTASLDP